MPVTRGHRPPTQPRSETISRSPVHAISVTLGLAGVALATALVGWFGFGRVLRAVASVGGAGFLAVCAWQMVLFVLLGLGWFVLVQPDSTWRPGVAVWGRMVRDAAGGLLPFSLVGGIVLGVRAVAMQGVAWELATATTVVDLTLEFLAQIALVLAGLVLLTARAPHARLVAPLALGLVAALACGAALLWLQRCGTAPLLALSRRVMGSSMPAVDGHMAAVQSALAGIYARPGRVAAGLALHLCAWLGTGVASWLAFRLLGADIDLASALGIEALLHAVLALAVLVPGYAGVQEAAYAGVAPLFGQSAELALAVSLLRRARDVAVGVPILLVWQGLEVRRRKRKQAVLF